MSDARRLVGSLIASVLLLVGALGVATPAAGQVEDQPVSAFVPVIVRITSAPVAGTYTVTWQTLGGCDPGEGTSGKSGETTMTVVATESRDDTPAPGELIGRPAAGIVVIRGFCTYTWSVSLVESTTGANCIVGPAPFAPDANNRIQITLTNPRSSCTQRSRIVVRLNPALPVSVDDTDHNTILRTRFTATARRVREAPRDCATKTGLSEVDDNGTSDDTTDDTVSIELDVLRTTAEAKECRYDVTLRVPRRLVATHGEHDHNVFENVNPLATIDFRVGVISKTIYVLQRVVGDSGGATVRYSLTKTCTQPPDTLPRPLLPAPVSDIRPIGPRSVVELREGRFNITAALAADPSVPDAFNGVPVRVLNHEGDTCEATVTVSNLPVICFVEETSQTVDLVRTPEPTIFEFEITCGDDVGNSTGDETSEDTDPDDEGDSGAEDTGNGDDTDSNGSPGGGNEVDDGGRTS